MTNERTGADLAPGRLIAGRFRLERLLGKGGMGSVWAARHLGLNVDVALKFIDVEDDDFDDAARRFAREATASARVRSPHVVNALDSGVDAFGRPYLAMELLEGEDLSARLERLSRLPVADVCRVVVHTCRGLARAHAAGVVHRDLKPENIFLCHGDDGFIAKVLDFGIAKAAEPAGALSHKTGEGQILGTPYYMSPEQALGREVDFRSDLYSLAVVAFCCLTGCLPFAADALGELIVKVSTEPVPSARALRPELPPAVDAWFRRALHKKPSKRFGSAREMADAFARACGLRAAYAGATPPPSTLAGPPGAAFAVAPRGAETLFGTTTNRTQPAARAWGGTWFAALFGVFLLGVLPFFLSSVARREATARNRPAPSAPRSTNAPAPSPSVTLAARSLSTPPSAPAADPAGAPPQAAASKAARVEPSHTVERHARHPAPRPAPHHAAPKPTPPARASASKGATDWGLD